MILLLTVKVLPKFLAKMTFSNICTLAEQSSGNLKKS